MSSKHSDDQIDSHVYCRPLQTLLKKIQLSRIVNPKNWSLRLRFLTVPAVLLGLGCITLAFFFQRYQNTLIVESVESRLFIFEQWVKDKITSELDILLSEVSPLGVMPEVVQSVHDRDKSKLIQFILPYEERLRATSGRDSLYFHFHLPPAISFLRTWDVNDSGADISDIRPMVVKSNKYHSPFKGIEIGPGGAAMRAIIPISAKGEHLGSVEAATSLENLLKSITIPAHFGVLLLIDNKYEKILSKNKMRAIHGKWIIGRGISFPDENSFLDALDHREMPTRLGKNFYHFLSLENFEGQSIGWVVLGFDSTSLFRSTYAEALILGFVFLIGGMFLWFHVYMNVARVKKFFKRLNRLLANTTIGDFSGRFETEPIHCLEILHCDKKNCLVYNDPLLICYLETGSEALSVKDRNTCCFLAKYKSCQQCPVYTRRRGDELVEMRHTVNTLLRLWGNFLGQVSQVVSGTLHFSNTSESILSMEQISNSLGYMSSLTAFSHDIQGVYSKFEVYNILSHSFEHSFGLYEFAILEIDDNTRSVEIIVNKFQKEGVLCREMFGKSDLCRAKRLAEVVCSRPNLALCPFFHVDQGSHVRFCMPIVMGGHVGGVISFVVDAMEFKTKQLALSIIHKYLMECAPVLTSLSLLEMTKAQSLRDPLTGVHNRRFLDDYLQQYEEISKRSGKRVGFLMVDVDYFKQVNDQHGHQTGDSVLKGLSELLKDTVRSADMVVRFGGEEFLILLNEVKQGLALKVAEKIRSSVEAHVFSLPNGTVLSKTVSVGVAEYPDDGDSFYKVIKFADVALYKAKESGRNRVVRFMSDMWSDDKY